MKLIQATVEESIRIPTIHNGGSHLFVGMSCSAAWGGGKIASLEYDAGKNSLAIRKDRRFNNAQKNEDYDVELVPWSRVIRASGVEGPAPNTDAPTQEPVGPKPPEGPANGENAQEGEDMPAARAIPREQRRGK
jgi:hypothetical protein